MTPETPIAQVLALMNPMRVSCQLCAEKQKARTIPAKRSCVLVVEDNRPIGIFTERDIVKLSTIEACTIGLTIADVMTRSPITLKQSESQDIFTAIFTLRQHSIRHLPVVDEDSRLVGIITREAIHEALQPVNLLANLRCAGDVMTKEVICAPKTASALELAQLMVKHRSHCVVIVEDQIQHPQRIVPIEKYQIPIGIVTERDIVQFHALELNLSEISATEAMSSPLFCISPGDSLFRAHQGNAAARRPPFGSSWQSGRAFGRCLSDKFATSF